jgi:site-specific recombinase XerD
MEDFLVEPAELIELAETAMKEANYKEDYMSKIKKTWRDLLDYLSEHDIYYLSKDVAVDFLEQCYGIPRNANHNKLKRSDKTRRRAVLILLNCQEFKKLNAPKRHAPYDFGNNFTELFSLFIEQRKQQGFAFTTVNNDVKCLNLLSSYLDSQGITDTASLVASNIIGFMEYVSSPRKIPTTKGISHTLRVILRYFYEQGMTATDLAPWVPVVKGTPHAIIPSAFSKEDVLCMLDSVDRGNPTGKRNYAILLLASKLGIRASDICGLTFENLKWDTNTIQFIQKKTGKPAVLPLLNDMGEAIIDYIKHGRPKFETAYVFLRHLTPVGPMKPGSLHMIAAQQFHTAKIVIPEGKRHGTHSLRFSLAAALLDNNTPLPIIKEILAHENSDTTKTYLKIGLRHLRELSLETPPWNPVWIGGAGK